MSTDSSLDWTIADFSGSDFHGALADLAANIMRVARGSGHASDIPQQLLTCAATLKRYAEENGTGLSPIEISKVLAAQRYEDTATGETNSPAVEDVISGSLQVAASRILRDREREYQGEAQILRAVRAGGWVGKIEAGYRTCDGQQQLASPFDTPTRNME